MNETSKTGEPARPFSLYATVKLKQSLSNDTREYPAGSAGTIIEIYSGGTSYLLQMDDEGDIGVSHEDIVAA